MSTWNNTWVYPALGAGAALVLAVWSSVWAKKRGNEAIGRWAAEQGFTVVHSARRSFVPHWRATSSRTYQFFRVDLRDREGFTRQAWMRCSALGRTDPATVQVIWDEK